MRARLGRTADRSTTASPVATLRTVAFSALVAIRSAGVQSKMSQRAARTGSDSRSGVPVTSRWTWESERLMPRSARGGARLAGGEHSSGGHLLAQSPLVADLAFHRALLAGLSAASMVASSARRRVRVRKSEDTQV